MNAVNLMESAPSKALTVAERAAVALNSSEHERKLLELAQASKSITGITNPAGREQCHGARMALKRVRVEIEKTGKAAREDATAFSKAVIAEQQRLISLTEPEEKRLTQIQDEYDERIAAEKRAKAAAEARRVAVIQERIEAIRETVLEAVAKTSEQIADHIRAVESTVIDETFAEFQQQAEGAKASTLVRLRLAHVNAEKLEAEQKRLAEERAELARQKAAEELRAAQERERIAEEQRRAREAAAAEAARQAEQLRRQREEQDAENARIRAKQEADAQAERDRLAEEGRRLSAQKAAQEAQERQQREAREAEDRRLAEQRAQLEREQEALRVQQEAIAKPSDPVEATSAEDVQPAVADAPQRPSDEEIVEAVAQAFFVSEPMALGWIMDVGNNHRMEAA